MIPKKSHTIHSTNCLGKFSSSLSDQASYLESCKMRPHLPRSTRPSSYSLFDRSNFLSVLVQAVIHLVTMEIGIRYGRKIEIQNPLPGTGAATTKQLVRPSTTQFSSARMAVILEALAKEKSLDQSNNSEKVTFFGRNEFQTNYETNVVCKFLCQAKARTKQWCLQL